MAAGLGYIEFATGDILTAAVANGYLASQTVMVFADASARSTAITSPQEGMMSYLKDTNATEYYSGSAWVAVGGSSPLTTKGDLYTYSTTNARLGVGTNGQVLTADSAEPTGLKWASSSGGSSGLTLITKSSFTSSTAVNIDSIFSSTYKDYRLVFDFTQGTNEAVYVRFRSGGSTYTGNTYEWRITSVASSNESGIFTYLKLGQNGTSRFGGQLELASPYVTGYTTWTLASTGLSTGAGAATYVGGGWNDTSRSEDGIQLYGSNGGAMTGQVLVYGYKES